MLLPATLHKKKITLACFACLCFIVAVEEESDFYSLYYINNKMLLVECIKFVIKINNSLAGYMMSL